jgi:hypothetical protein
MLRLVRLVLDDAWSAAEAAATLRQMVPDDTVLYQLRSRVRRALAERTSPAGERASATLEITLNAPDPTEGRLAKEMLP